MISNGKFESWIFNNEPDTVDDQSPIQNTENRISILIEQRNSLKNGQTPFDDRSSIYEELQHWVYNFNYYHMVIKWNFGVNAVDWKRQKVWV